MKTDYVLRRRALLGISALFCTTLLLFGCQDSADPVGPELDSPTVSETAGVTFAAKGKPPKVTFEVSFAADAAFTPTDPTATTYAPSPASITTRHGGLRT